MADGSEQGTRVGAPPWPWRLLVGLVRGLLHRVFGWRLRVLDHVDVDPDEALVVAVNHVSNVDPFLAADAVLRRTGHWVQPLAKAELFDVPVLGTLARRAGAIPVARETEEGRDAAYAAAVARLGEGGTIYIAPEGTITHDGELLPLRHGAARLALEADVRVLVVTSFGAQRAWSPVAGLPHRGAHVHVALDLLDRDPTDDAASLTGRIAATMLARSEELAAGYPQGGPGAPWWPPYPAPGTPTAQARQNLERYRTSMAEAVEGARARMAELAAERDVEQRFHEAQERARSAATAARRRAEELAEQMRHRAEEIAELGRTGALGERARHRAEELAGQARALAEQARGLVEEADDDPVADGAGAHDPAADGTPGRAAGGTGTDSDAA